MVIDYLFRVVHAAVTDLGVSDEDFSQLVIVGNDMLKMIQSVKFKQVNSPFLNKLKEDTDRIKNEPKLLIAADKTTNFYKLEPSTYNDLLEKKQHKILQESPTQDDASNPQKQSHRDKTENRRQSGHYSRQRSIHNT